MESYRLKFAKVFCRLLCKTNSPKQLLCIPNRSFASSETSQNLRKTVLIGGGSGFIGSALSALLQGQGYSVIIVSRMPGYGSISWNDLMRDGLPQNVSAVVNLAGQNVLDYKRRWTPGFKQNVVASRVNTTKALANAIIKAEKKPEVFVTISGVGIYEPSATAEYTEDSPVHNFDFLSELCLKWEKAAELPEDCGVRRVTIRSGVVLGRFGGMIKQLFIPFYVGVGGPIGTGKQYMPWIHIEDIRSLFLFAIKNKNVEGILNGVAPEIITNKQFTKALGRAMWRPTIFPVPEIVLKVLFNEERAKMMTEGQKVIPKRTLEYGFQYIYPDIYNACMAVINLDY